MDSSLAQSKLDALSAQASFIHRDAWGKQWPASGRHTIRFTDLRPSTTAAATPSARPMDAPAATVDVDKDQNLTTTTPSPRLTDAPPDAVHSDDMAIDEDHKDLLKDLLDVQYDELTYDYLNGVQKVAAALGSATMIRDCLVLRGDYVYLRKEIERLKSHGRQAVTIVGQPGIGIYVEVSVRVRRHAPLTHCC